MSRHDAETPRWTRRAGLSRSLSVAVMILSGTTCAHASIEHYEGTAFDTSGRALYTESHWNRGDGSESDWLILFRCPDGKAFARKRVKFVDQAQAPLFELEDARLGYREGVRITASGQREVFVRRANGLSEKLAVLAPASELVIDAGFDRFIVSHWDDLVAGRKFTIDFLVPSRLRTYKFVLDPAGPDTIGGAPVQRFRLRLDAWFGLALPSIEMAYASSTKRIREYSGVSNIRDASGRNLEVSIDFPPNAPTIGAQPQEIAAALAIPLDGQCTL